MSALVRLVLSAYGLAALLAATDGHAQGAQGENFSAKPPAVLFNTDCTGSGCHGGPQGLARGKSVGDLSSYLREHYTNSRQSAAALAAYLAGVPGANNARAPRPERDDTAREKPARETPARESSKRGPPAREEPKKEESDSIFPSFPSLQSIFGSPSSPPETAKRDEAPARSRSRTGRRDDAVPVVRPPAALREETTPQSRPSTARRDEAAKPSGEGDGAKPARSRSRTPSNQLPKIEDPNLPSENEIYRPARPRQQPLSEDEGKPAETTVTNVPASAPESTPNVSSTPATGTPPSQGSRSRSRTPAAETGGAAPADAAKPPKTRASQRQSTSSTAVPPVAPPSESQSAPPAQATSAVPQPKPREPIFD